MLLKLLRHSHRDDLQHSVISLLPEGPLADSIKQVGCPVYTLDLCRERLMSLRLRRFKRVLLDLDPDVLQGWMYHGNIAAWWASRWYCRSAALLWNVRHSLSDIRHEKLGTQLMIRGGAMLSSAPRRIIYNSNVASEQHAGIGYRSERALVIPNGFDLQRFRLDDAARVAVRNQLGIPDDSFVIGMAARNHPMKDYANLVEALRLYFARDDKAHAILIGRNVGPDHPVFRSFASDPRVHLLGEQSEMERWYNAMDVCSLSSAWGEAFPNVLGEAMACEVPCVATDVGDAGVIIGDTGAVVPIRDAKALCDAWVSLRDAGGRARWGALARKRIEASYGIDTIVRAYEEVYQSSKNSAGE